MNNSAGRFPVTQANVEETYEFVFAPWVKAQGLCDFVVSEGRVAARLPYDTRQAFFTEAVCGQALMSAIDTVAALAMATTPRPSKGTIYQHTHFLRPAVGEAFLIEAEVIRFGKATAYAETSVTEISSKALIARASSEFAF